MKSYQHITQKDLLRLTCLIMEYEKIYDDLPDTLEKLQLSKPLYDPMAKDPATPYKYSKTDRKLWSEGMNYESLQDSISEKTDYEAFSLKIPELSQ